MQLDSTINNRSQIPVKDGVIVLSGYSVSINVDKGFLILKDGLGKRCREGRYFKATSGIKRLVIHGHHGVISLAALKWLFDIGAGIIQIDWDGDIIFASVPHRENINLKRVQFSALHTRTGLALSIYLMYEKIHGQLKVIEKYAPDDAYTYNRQSTNCVNFLRSLYTELKSAKSISRVNEIESLAANLYWGLLSKKTLQFQQKDNGKIPEHWKTFGSRHSLINRKSNRNAINPANAMMNYLYALLYAETRLALLKAGLDPTAGIFHADDLYRDSFAYDVMEAVRSDVDIWLLEFVTPRATMYQ
jgi:CRISPR-associated protein Cas1